MIKDSKVLALIPARGGSKAIHEKNIYQIMGKPLIEYTIESAKKSKYIDEIIVSTDSDKIANISRKCGAKVPFIRPFEIASDTASTIEVLIHAINELNAQVKFDCIILLQPTSPLRDENDIDVALEIFIDNGKKSLISVSKVYDNPVLIRRIHNNQLYKILNNDSSVRRQDMPEFYKVNGSIYINRICDIHSNTSLNDNVIPYIMDKSHSVDIDDYSDVCLAEYYIKNKEE